MKRIYLLLAGLTFFACTNQNNQEVNKGSASNTEHSSSSGISKSYDFTQFNALDISSNMEITLTQGAQYSVSLEADPKHLEDIKVELIDQELHIRSQRKINLNKSKVKVFITAPEFRKIELSGACVLEATNSISSQQPLAIEMSGATDVHLVLDVPRLKIDASGATQGRFKGKTEVLEIEGSGALELDAVELEAKSVSVDISGAGSAKVWATTNLRVELSGAASLQYKGQPVNTHFDKSGIASITAIP